MVALLAAPTALAGPDDDDDDDGEAAAELRIAAEPIVEAPAPAVYDFADDLVPETVAVSPGGARDIDLVRAAIESGGVPTAQQITAEGLFAEHDLPLRVSGRCEQTLCLRLETIAATLIAAPAVHYLAQIGFASDLDLTSFRRPRLNLVIVM
ncbi:MAG: hypothetical protein KC636_14205, partial [Myxococcales bacterium]|nr:hypothetical protein [Myxococcales bacterium]